MTYFCILDKYSPQPLDKKVSEYGFKFKRFLCIKDGWRNHGFSAQKNLRGLLSSLCVCVCVSPSLSIIWHIINHFKLHKATEKRHEHFQQGPYAVDV